MVSDRRLTRVPRRDSPRGGGRGGRLLFELSGGDRHLNRPPALGRSQDRARRARRLVRVVSWLCGTAPSSTVQSQDRARRARRLVRVVSWLWGTASSSTVRSRIGRDSRGPRPARSPRLALGEFDLSEHAKNSIRPRDRAKRWSLLSPLGSRVQKASHLRLLGLQKLRGLGKAGQNAPGPWAANFGCY